MAGFDMSKMQSHANHLWEFLNEMHDRDPEEYGEFLKKQMAGVDAAGVPKQKQSVDEIPTPGLCMRMRLRSQTPVYVNICAHSRLEAPSKMADSSVPIAVGVPRPASLPEGAGLAVDVVVNPEVTRCAERDLRYREEVAALAAQCVKEILADPTPSAVVSGPGKGTMTESRAGAMLPEPLAPGYRILSTAKYAGTPQPFVDARQPQRPPEPSSSADAMSALEKLVGSMAGKGPGAGKGAPPTTAGGGGARDKPEGRQSGGARAKSPGVSLVPGAADDEDGGGIELRLPGQQAEPQAVGAAKGDEQGPSRPLVQELASEPAVAETPEYELEQVDGLMTLRVKLPRVAAAAELDLEVGDTAVSVCAEGLYQLMLQLPVAGASAEAASKFDKKRRVLTVRMPIAA